MNKKEEEKDNEEAERRGRGRSMALAGSRSAERRTNIFPMRMNGEYGYDTRMRFPKYGSCRMGQAGGVENG